MVALEGDPLFCTVIAAPSTPSLVTTVQVPLDNQDRDGRCVVHPMILRAAMYPAPPKSDARPVTGVRFLACVAG